MGIRAAGACMGLAIAIARVVLGAILVWASLPKIADPERLFLSIQSYQIGGNVLSLFGVIVLPWFELSLGVSLLWGLFPRTAFAATAGLFLVFAVAQLSVLRRGLSVDCGCGLSDSEDAITMTTAVRSLLLMAISLAGLWCEAIRLPASERSALSSSAASGVGTNNA